jgi:hypothetical protein
VAETEKMRAILPVQLAGVYQAQISLVDQVRALQTNAGPGETRLYRVPVANGGPGQTEMERYFEGKEARETSDGRVLYIKNDRPGLFSRSLARDPNANPEERLVDDITGPIGYFAPVAQGIYYTGQDSFGNYAAFRFFDYARHQSLDVASKVATGNINSLAVSPDGRSLLYTQVPGREANLTLLQF